MIKKCFYRFLCLNGSEKRIYSSKNDAYLQQATSSHKGADIL